jgi:hypothetical protein
VAAMFVNGSGRNEHLYIGPSIDASYQISDQLDIHYWNVLQRHRSRHDIGLVFSRMTDFKG